MNRESYYDKVDFFEGTNSSDFSKNKNSKNYKNFFYALSKFFFDWIKFIIYIIFVALISMIVTNSAASRFSSFFSLPNNDDFSFVENENYESLQPSFDFLENCLFNENSRKVIKENLSYNQLVSPFRASSKKKAIVENMLFYGSPGTGKSYAAKMIAENFSCGYFYASAGTFEKIYVGTGASKIQKLFKRAREIERKKKFSDQKPVFIIIDEIDSFAGKKNLFGSGDDTLVNTFLTEVDRTLNDGSNIVLIGTTNVIDRMEEAAVRSGRFSYKVEFSPPQSQDEISKVFFYAVNSLKSQIRIDDFSQKDKKEQKIFLKGTVYISTEFIQIVSERIFLKKRQLSRCDDKTDTSVPSFVALIKSLISANIKDPKSKSEHEEILMIEESDVNIDLACNFFGI